MIEMKIDQAYQEKLFKKLFKSLDLKKEKQLFDQLFKKPIFWLLKGTSTKGIFPLNGKFRCPNVRGPKRKKCLNCLSRILNKTEKSQRLEQFVCPEGCYGLCLPIVQGDAFYGFLLICNFKSRPSGKSLRLFEALNSTILEKAQKELELSKLYRTIRPRAIALSTIHTVHRLISSTLDPEELLPRIARLSLQILRAKRCLISLTDKKTKRLVAKVDIDLSKKGIKPRISPLTRLIEKRVMATGNILLKKSYLSVPLVDEESIGVITVFKKMSKRPFDNFDQEILMALSEQAIGAIKNAQLYKEQEDMILGAVKSISSLLKVQSAHSYTHPKAFVDIVLGIAKKLELSEEDLRNLRYAAMLHDAEKIGIPEEILKKPAQLTGKELKIVKEYPKKGVKLLSPMERLKPAMAIILHHHEKFDGSGYPNGLKGQEIPLGARIMAIADSFEAMISQRPYRKSTSISDAIKELKKYSGRQFDPAVIKAFLKLTQDKSFKKLSKDIYRG